MSEEPEQTGKAACGPGQTGDPAREPEAQRKPEARRPSRPGHDDRPVLPPTAPEDRDEAWGDAPARRDRDWYEQQRPPHHG